MCDQFGDCKVILVVLIIDVTSIQRHMKPLKINLTPS